jgi:hypothetical protein
MFSHKFTVLHMNATSTSNFTTQQQMRNGSPQSQVLERESNTRHM